MLKLVRPPFDSNAQEQFERACDPAEYQAIKQLWLDHITAEHSAHIPGLMATLTEDCVYTILNNGQTWHGHKGATEFYEKFLAAFPENCFKVINTFIGPQGVVEEAHFNGVLTGSFMSLPVTGEAVQFHVTLIFPWDQERKLFKGERIYFAMEWSLIANMGKLLRRMAQRGEQGEGDVKLPGLK
jgi:predicted ester cyclase